MQMVTDHEIDFSEIYSDDIIIKIGVIHQIIIYGDEKMIVYQIIGD